MTTTAEFGTDLGARQKGVCIIKPIVYGNIARYFGRKREEDGHTHQWTVYVKPYRNEDMSTYVKKMHFRLHESYANSNRVVVKPPYEVTETGWGEFEVIIKIYFNDPNEKPCYAPTNDSDAEKKSEFYGRHQAVVDQKAKKDLLIMMGDFNAKIGKDNIGKELVMEKEGLGEINENGELFTDFCHFNSLVIGLLLREEQAGFWKERSCTDHIATLRVITEQSLEWKERSCTDHIATLRVITEQSLEWKERSCTDHIATLRVITEQSLEWKERSCTDHIATLRVITEQSLEWKERSCTDHIATLRVITEQSLEWKERSCTDHIATLRVTIEQSVEWNSPLYITFVDFEKAFDSIDHIALWKLFAHYGIPKKIIRLIHTTYEPSTCQVVYNGSLTEPFSILSGVRQECLLSPFLFQLAVDWIMASTIEGCSGVSSGHSPKSKQLEHIDFVDDVTLLSHRRDNMQDKVTPLYESAAKLGLKINKKKTRTMRANHVNKNSIQLRGEDIEDVEQFT
ncbi:hypothetical protein LSAT2_020751 [Lamellibrachia satsuma]|nr:hypothetical protein LSAT2_020751 [Lamellibrachia satsuma]